MADERTTPSSVVATWLAAVSLTAASEDAGRTDTPASNIVAVAAGHAACEAGLGALAGLGNTTPPRNETFVALLDRAIAEVDARGSVLPSRLRRELSDINEARNLALHRRVAVAHETALRAASTARDLLGLLADVFDGLGPAPPGSSFASAVAALVEVELIASDLRAAEARLRAGDHIASADHQARALRYALSRADLPQLDMDRPHMPRSMDDNRYIWEAIGSLAIAGEQDRHWILSLAIGVPQRQIDRLSLIHGHVLDVRPGPKAHRVEDPSPDDVSWALATTSQIIYRLTAGGTLSLTAWERERAAGDGV